MKLLNRIVLITSVLATCGCSTNPPSHMERMEVDFSSNTDPHDGYTKQELMIIRCQEEQQEQCYHVVMSMTQMRKTLKAIKAGESCAGNTYL